MPRQQRELLRAFATPEGVRAAPDAAIDSVAPGAAAKLARPPDAVVEQHLEWLSQPQHHLVTLADEDYPRSLLETADPPVQMLAMGRRDLLASAPMLAVVGSRNATAQGSRDAEGFARSLSQAGVTIVSGLALGIDAAAHRGGLAGRGGSVAVIGNGPDRIYPARNEALARTLAEEGLVLTEFPLGTPPLREHFPRRNRIIAGLARGVLVVEAAPASGSLITARLAADAGRDVFAIPGSIHSPFSKGCHALIKQGAKLVECAEDVLIELGVDARTAPASAPTTASGITPRQQALLDALGYSPTLIDTLCAQLAWPAADVLGQLAELEIAGWVTPLAGGRYQRVV
jgi:DNA processing protein